MRSLSYALMSSSSQKALCLRCNRQIGDIPLLGPVWTGTEPNGATAAVATTHRQKNGRKHRKLTPEQLQIMKTTHLQNQTKDRKHRKLTPQDLENMVKQFNDWWSYNYRGMQIHFNFTLDDYQFLTTSEPARARNMILYQRLLCMGLTSPITIVEAFAGCGADTISFIADIPNIKAIYACDKDPDKRNMALQNVKNFVQAYNDAFMHSGKRPHPLVSPVPQQPSEVDYGHARKALMDGPPVKRVGIETYSFDVASEGGKSIVEILPTTIEALFDYTPQEGAIDLLYLDPPWASQEHDGDAGGTELTNFLNVNVFNPMITHVHPINWPKLVILKTRFTAEVRTASACICTNMIKSS